MGMFKGDGMSRGDGYVQGGPLLCDLFHNTCDVTSPPREQADACEGITFPQLPLWAVITTIVMHRVILVNILEFPLDYYIDLLGNILQRHFAANFCAVSLYVSNVC